MAKALPRFETVTCVLPTTRQYHRDTDKNLHGQEETEVPHGNSGAATRAALTTDGAAAVEMIRDKGGDDDYNPT